MIAIFFFAQYAHIFSGDFSGVSNVFKNILDLSSHYIVLCQSFREKVSILFTLITVVVPKVRHKLWEWYHLSPFIRFLLTVQSRKSATCLKFKGILNFHWINILKMRRNWLAVYVLFKISQIVSGIHFIPGSGCGITTEITTKVPGPLTKCSFSGKH